MKQVEEIIQSLGEWQKEDGDAKRSYLLFCVDGISGEKCVTSVSGNLVDLVASVAESMLSDNRIYSLIKGATNVCEIKEGLDKIKKDGTDTRN